MQRRMMVGWVVALATLANLLLVASPPALAQSAPQISQARTQIAVREDGTYDITYRLTFRETDSRDRITTLGPLDPGHTIIDARLEYGNTRRSLDLRALGDNQYRVPFGMTTQRGEEYTLQVRYTTSNALAATTYGGTDYRVVGWGAIQWNLPIEEQIVTFILPIELPAGITREEQVTDEVVDESGLIIEPEVVSRFDTWAYYPTVDETTGASWLSVYAARTDLSPPGAVRTFFLRASTLFLHSSRGPTKARR
ncbi:MAG: hypothetical protein HC884_18170, partial [Chloroflexaceae bacterium]|nr:hypothetical protein [Chloroflexaceae bacterium]